MNSKSPIFATLISSFSAVSLALDPIINFKDNYAIDPDDKILKRSADINGDGHNETFLVLKSAYSEDKDSNNTPAWNVYLSIENGSNAIRSKGIQDSDDENDSIGVGGLPDIDTDLCHVGQIAEISKHGIVTVKYKSHHPLDGETAIIYAYTVEEDHLKQHQLAEFDSSEVNEIFNKYLAEDKKTTIAVTEIDP